MDDVEFLLGMMAEGWRMETDCGPCVQFVQDRFEPHAEMPRVISDDVGATGYHGPETFSSVMSLCTKLAFEQLKASQEGAE